MLLWAWHSCSFGGIFRLQKEEPRGLHHWNEVHILVLYSLMVSDKNVNNSNGDVRANKPTQRLYVGVYFKVYSLKMYLIFLVNMFVYFTQLESTKCRLKTTEQKRQVRRSVWRWRRRKCQSYCREWPKNRRWEHLRCFYNRIVEVTLICGAEKLNSSDHGVNNWIRDDHHATRTPSWAESLFSLYTWLLSSLWGHLSWTEPTVQGKTAVECVCVCVHECVSNFPHED